MKKTKVLIIITLIILIAIFITGGFLILNSLSKKNSSGGNVGEISDTESNKEETWSSQNLDDEEYYYYPTQTAIKRIRRDTMDYKTIYLSEDTSRCQIDAEMVTIYGDYIYFFRTDYIYGDSHNKIYSFIIGKIDKNGEKQVEDLITKVIDERELEKQEKCATSEAFFYVINDKMYKFNFKDDSEEVYAEGEELPSYFEVSEDNAIYYGKSGTIYKMKNGKTEKLYEGSFKEGYSLIKQGDNLYFTGATLGFDVDGIQYYSLKDKEIKEIKDDKKGLVFNRGNMIYLYGSDNIIYKLRDEKWEEYAKLNNFTRRSMGDPIILNEDTFIIAKNGSKDKTYIYNFKEGKEYVYGVVDEENATEDSYVENKLKSTKRLEERKRVEKYGTVIYVINSEKQVLSGDIGESLSYRESELKPFCTEDEMLSVMGNGTMSNISELDIYDGYCYWVASVYDENNLYTTAVLRKKCDGTENVEIVKKTEGKSQGYQESYYYEGGFMLITFNSVYMFVYNSQQLTLLYTLTIGGREVGFYKFDDSLKNEIYKKHILFLDKEVVIKNPVNGRFYICAYDGTYKNLELFDRSYNARLGFVKYVNTFSYYYTNVKDNYLIFYDNCKINLDTGKVEKLEKEDL